MKVSLRSCFKRHRLWATKCQLRKPNFIEAYLSLLSAKGRPREPVSEKDCFLPADPNSKVEETGSWIPGYCWTLLPLDTKFVKIVKHLYTSTKWATKPVLLAETEDRASEASETTLFMKQKAKGILTQTLRLQKMSSTIHTNDWTLQPQDGPTI